MKGASALLAHRESLQEANRYLTDLLKPCKALCEPVLGPLCYRCGKKEIDEDYLREALVVFRSAFGILTECLSNDAASLQRRREAEGLPLERRAGYNANSTINLLPKEIFTLILTWVVQDRFETDDTRSYRTLDELQLVCAGWNQWIKATPVLWSFIDLGCWNYRTIERHLVNAKSASLSVRHSMSPHSDHAKFHDFTSQILPHCRMVDLVLPADLLAELATTPAPALQTASVLADVPETASIDLFTSYAPALKRIDLCKVRPVGRSSVFAGLSCLKISSVYEGSGLTNLVDTLLHCPQLSTLEISYCCLTEERLTLNQPVPIVLPKLQVLLWEESTANALAYVLDNLETSAPVKKLTIQPEETMDERETSLLQRGVAKLFRQAKDSFRPHQGMHLEVTDDQWVRFDTEGLTSQQDSSLDIALNGPSSSPWVTWFCQSIAPCLPDTLILSVESSMQPNSPAFRKLGTLHQVASLAIASTPQGSACFMDLISQPLSNSNSTGEHSIHWPFRGLLNLSLLNDDVSGFHLLNMVKTRYGQGGHGDAGVGKAILGATELETLQLPYMNKLDRTSPTFKIEENNFFLEVRTIVGRDVLQFGTKNVRLYY